MVRERDKAKELGGSSEWTQESGPIQRQNKYVNVNDWNLEAGISWVKTFVTSKSCRMEAATALLLQGGEQEFMRITSTAMKIIQNVLCEPGEEKYRRVRAASKVCRTTYER